MRYLMTFSYDGTNYNGYQKQPNKNTIQDQIESALLKIFGKEIKIHASGRTDAKVHALNQKAHFDLDKEMDLYKLKKSINSLINKDIYIKEIKQVPDDFHARFNVVEKTYIYKLNVGCYDPINRNYIYQYNKELDINSMKKATKYLIGIHNFKAFTKTDVEKDDYIRNIYSIDLEKDNDLLTLTFKGNGFLRYMVRNIVGTLIQVGENKLKIEDISHIIESEDRSKAGKTANPEGLYLKDVKYDIK